MLMTSGRVASCVYLLSYTYPAYPATCLTVDPCIPRFSFCVSSVSAPKRGLQRVTCAVCMHDHMHCKITPKSAVKCVAMEPLQHMSAVSVSSKRAERKCGVHRWLVATTVRLRHEAWSAHRARHDVRMTQGRTAGHAAQLSTVTVNTQYSGMRCLDRPSMLWHARR